MTEEFPTKKHRNRALHHIRHDLIMMRYSLDRLLTSEFRDSNEMNLLIESCTLHARTLCFFLVQARPPSRKPNSHNKFDVWIGDYFVYSGSQTVGRDDAPSLTSFADRAGKFLAHLSYRRDLDPKLNVRDLRDVVVEIEKRMAEFRKLADNDVDWSLYESP